MKSIAYAFIFCLVLNLSAANNLHPTIKYPKGHALQGTAIDTALVGAPVKLTTQQAQKYFPHFKAQEEVAYSNIGSGIEYEWFIIKLPLNKNSAGNFTQMGILHNEFSQGLFHGSILFKSERKIEFVPQNPNSKLLKPFKSPYLVASFEGLRKRGMSFGIQNIVAGNLIASWNFYTFKGTLAMAIKEPVLGEMKKLNREEINIAELAKTIYYQESTLDAHSSQNSFRIFLNQALHESYTKYYNPVTLTCNNAIENVLDLSQARLKQKSMYSHLNGLFRRRYVNNFHLHLLDKGYVKTKRVLLSSLKEFHHVFHQAIQEYQEGTKYGR